MFTTIDDIEYEYNLEFLSNIKNTYKTNIIDIFNSNLANYSILEKNDPEINIILAIYYNCNNNKDKAIQILTSIETYSRALCTLGVMYTAVDTNISIEYLLKAANLGDMNAVNNLAYQYYLQYNVLDDSEKMFHHYNNLLDDERKFINLALFEYKIKNNYNIGVEYIIKACELNSYRANYLYAIDFLCKNTTDDTFYKYLFIGFKIKPKKQYIKMFINDTTPEIRFLLFNKYDYPIESFIKYDKTLNNLNCKILKNKVCPICLIKKKLNIKLKCSHSFCDLCFIKYKECILCNS
jgi:hypothetical protein